MESHGSLENHISAWGLSTSVTIQMTLRAAIELDVFNIIAKAGSGAHLTSKQIVSQIPTTNPKAAVENLERMLRYLSVHSLLSTSQTPNPNDPTIKDTSYGLTEDTLCLVPNEDGVSFAPFLIWKTEMHSLKSLSMLKYTVLEPESSPFLKAHGETPIYEYMSKKPGLPSLFDEVMKLHSYICYERKVFEEYKGFEEVKELMDVGGGDGSAIAKIVSVYPHIQGINFNLPSGVARAPEYPGVKHVNGDMFETIPYTQAIMLKLILHNWDDDHCKKILRNCSNALPNNGKVIVVEYCVLPEVIENTLETKTMLLPADIAMMTLCNGKERTISEYDALAKSVGFVQTKAFPICHGTYVIEFLK
uniref:(S)-scoulerine 9-O-methyltransferase-like isoform X1 n=1 Tax=Fragaria vesca subsp. vesca TaxID=101020 RepID=UPI0005C9370C|nr:PREDICTED: (S)-scoulerine 9-O-methyltransferase-like isoform X1 [Fragaria vesca subsp. vesca]